MPLGCLLIWGSKTLKKLRDYDLNKGLLSVSSKASATILGGELNFSVTERLNKGLTDNPQLGHFFGVRKYSGEELNFTVEEWLNRG